MFIISCTSCCSDFRGCWSLQKQLLSRPPFVLQHQRVHSGRRAIFTVGGGQCSQWEEGNVQWWRYTFPQFSLPFPGLSNKLQPDSPFSTQILVIACMFLEATGLCLFVLLLSTLVCYQPTELIWAFLFHTFSNFTPPPLSPLAVSVCSLVSHAHALLRPFSPMMVSDGGLRQWVMVVQTLFCFGK